MLDVQFIFPGVFDNLYSWGAWWIFGYAAYATYMTSCNLVINAYSFFIAFFGGDFSQSFKQGAEYCNNALTPMW